MLHFSVRLLGGKQCVALRWAALCYVTLRCVWMVYGRLGCSVLLLGWKLRTTIVQCSVCSVLACSCWGESSALCYDGLRCVTFRCVAFGWCMVGSIVACSCWGESNELRLYGVTYALF